MKAHNDKDVRTPEPHGFYMRDKILVHLSPELKALIGQEADKEQVPGGMGEVLVRLAAKHFKRPDLAYVPRKPFGRPRKNGVATPA